MTSLSCFALRSYLTNKSTRSISQTVAWGLKIYVIAKKLRMDLFLLFNQFDYLKTGSVANKKFLEPGTQKRSSLVCCPSVLLFLKERPPSKEDLFIGLLVLGYIIMLHLLPVYTPSFSFLEPVCVKEKS